MADRAFSCQVIYIVCLFFNFTSYNMEAKQSSDALITRVLVNQISTHARTPAGSLHDHNRVSTVAVHTTEVNVPIKLLSGEDQGTLADNSRINKQLS